MSEEGEEGRRERGRCGTRLERFVVGGSALFTFKVTVIVTLRRRNTQRNNCCDSEFCDLILLLLFLVFLFCFVELLYFLSWSRLIFFARRTGRFERTKKKN